jgi:hypothetical protein
MRQLRLGLAIACGASSISAAQEIAPQQPFMSLLKQGYEIKATTVVPLEEQRQLASSSTHSYMLITMQKGQSVAVCTITWTNWSNLQKPSLEDARLCDVR